MKNWGRAIVGRPFLFVVPLGLLLFLPHYGLGFLFDDHYHLAVLEGLDPQAPVSAMELWSWHREGRTPLFAGSIQGDVLPWWAADDLKIDFFRPLPSLLHQLDHAVWGRNVVGLRATSFVVWAFLLAAVVALYREIGRHGGTGPGVAFLAGVFFAVDECHTWNVLWLATRHSLLAVLFSAAAVTAYLRFRRTQDRRALWAALTWLVAGLLSSEVTVAVAGWVAAYELISARERWTERLRAASPMAAVVGLYVVLYKVAGFGTHGSRWYLDPLDAPATLFTDTLPLRLPRFVQGLLTPLPAEVGLLFPTPGLATAGLVGTALVIAAMLPLLLRDRTFRFVALAALLSLLPTAIVVPINYLLLWPSVGTAWLLARLTTWAWDAARSRLRQDRLGQDSLGQDRPNPMWRRAPAALLALVVFVTHGLAAPAMSQVLVGQLRGAANLSGWLADRTDYPAPEEAEGARVLFVTFPWSVASSYVAVAWRVTRPQPWPDALWTIATRYGDFRFERTGEKSFRVECPEPGVLDSLWESLVQDGSNVAEGRRFHRGAMTVTLEKMADDGTLRQFEVQIDRPLDDPKVWLLAWDGERLSRFQPPPIGEAITLRSAPRVPSSQSPGSSSSSGS